MKRTSIAAAALSALAACAQAQTVTAYGLLDLAVEHVGQVGTSGAGLTRVPSLTGTFPSRIGFRGTEDLGGGLRAVFTLEQGFAPDAGNFTQGGRAWGRQAFVGLSGTWGALTLGRQYTMLYWSLLDADVLGPGLYGTGSLDAYIPNSRADNAVAYRGSFDGLTVGATYSLGRDVVNAGSAAGTNCAGELANDKSACREWSAMVKWDTAAWGAALAWDEIRGGPGALFGLNSSSLKDSRLSANGYVKWGDFKGSLGLVRRDNKAGGATPRSDLWYLGAVWAAAPGWVVDCELLRLSFKHGDAATLVAARATYSLSKRTAIYGQWGHIGNGGSLAISVSAGAGGSAPAPGAGQSAYAIGLRHLF